MAKFKINVFDHEFCRRLHAHMANMAEDERHEYQAALKQADISLGVDYARQLSRGNRPKTPLPSL